MQRPHSSRLYLLAPGLYATSRKARAHWEALSSKERRRYLGLARDTSRDASSDPLTHRP